MGVETVALAAITAGMGIYQGISAQRASNEQAKLMESDGILLESEARREAGRIVEEGQRFADQQKMAYIGSGVEIGGSAVVTLAQTDKWAQEEATAVRDRATAIRKYYDRSAKIARNQGMASFISGIAQGAASAFGVYSAGKGVATSNVGASPVGTGTLLGTPKTTGKSGYGSRASAYQSLRVK